MITFSAGSQRAYMLASFVLVIGLLFTGAVHALGMGKIKVYSYLDEPLVAEIELIGTDGLDPYQLIVKLASAQDFTRAGLERPFFLNNIDFDVIFYNGKGYIFMRSVKPVQMPYLEFLVELSWPEGSLIKDYTILIDPPPANLTKDNRPLAFGQLAQIEAQQRSFGTDVIAEQLSEQELIGSGARILTPKKTEQKSFSDQDVQVVTSETGEVTVSDTPELVPEVVPDVTEEDLELRPSATSNAQTQNPVTAPSVSSQPVEISSPKTTTAEQNAAKFNEQLAEFDKKQQEKFSKTKRKSWVGSLAPADKVLPDEKPTKPKSSQSITVEEQPATAEQIQQEIATEVVTEPEEEIDFSTVIEPVAVGQDRPAVDTPTNDSGSIAVASDKAVSTAPAEEGKSIILPLIFTVFAVVSLAVGGLAAKKYILDKKANSDKDDSAESTGENQEAYDWDAEPELDDDFAVVESVVTKPVESKDDEIEFASMQEEQSEPVTNKSSPRQSSVEFASATPSDTPAEEIELAPPPKQETPEDLAAVEAELANLDLDTISPDPEINLTDDTSETEIPVSGKEAPDLFPEPEIDIDSSLKLAPEADDAEESAGPEVEKAASIESLSVTQPGLRDADIDMKLDLARKYIDAGDKESAKSLLLEVQEIAIDEQKVDVEMLLSTLM